MSVNILKFVKDDNGSVRLFDVEEKTLLASFNPNMTIIKDRSKKDTFIIQNEKGENPFVLNYLEVGRQYCIPAIIATDFNEFLIELADKFFYTSQEPEVQKNSTYGIVRPTFVHSRDFITTNSKLMRIVKSSEDPYVMVSYGGYDSQGKFFLKPYYGGTDLNAEMEVELPVKSLFSLDDMFLRFSVSTRAWEFEAILVVNPDSNTFTFYNADPLYIYSDAEYKTDAVSDTLYLVASTGDEGNPRIRARVRWKNVPELEDTPV
jgi:hypothetical protein